MPLNIDRIESLVRQLLIEIGEDPEREGLLKTPQRVALSLEFLTSGYRQDIDTVVNHALFAQEVDSLILVRDIELYSLCEHHMLPFYGRCHIAYLPNEKVIGVSKLARLVDMYARRLQIQERLTGQVAHAVMDIVDAQGVGVIIEAHHLCMMMRGVQKQNSMLTTSSMLGYFREHDATRNEFLALVSRDRV